MGKKITFILCAILICGSLTSCATLFANKHQSLSFSSEPNGAIVYVNGFKMGKTPVELKLQPKKDYIIEFRKDGYESVTRTLNTKTGAGWIVLDVLGGVIPIVVDAATGNWKKFDTDNVRAALIKKED